MAVTIEKVDTQNILIDTDFSVDINITSTKELTENPIVRGIALGFNYKWNGSQVQIYGKANRLYSDAQFTVIAKDADGTVEQKIKFNIVPPAPIIGNVNKLMVVRGTVNTFKIPIANMPCEVSVRGPLIGFGTERTEEGVTLTGYIPSESEANFTIDKGTAHVVASNAGGTDESDIEWEFKKADNRMTNPDI